MKSEFKGDVWKLNHQPPEHFTQFVWEYDTRPTLKYVVFSRFVNYVSIAFATTTIILLLTKYDKYYLFFDFWCVMLIAIALMPPIAHFKKTYGHLESWDSLDWGTRINWVFYSAAIPAAVVGAASYWILLYELYPYIFLMILNSVPVGIILITTFITSVPLKLVYCIFFVVFYVSYIFFTAGYQMSGNKGPKGVDYIYKALNWKETEKAMLTAFIGLLGGLLVYFVFCFLSMAKLTFKGRY